MVSVGLLSYELPLIYVVSILQAYLGFNTNEIRASGVGPVPRQEGLFAPFAPRRSAAAPRPSVIPRQLNVVFPVRKAVSPMCSARGAAASLVSPGREGRFFRPLILHCTWRYHDIPILGNDTVPRRRRDAPEVIPRWPLDWQELDHHRRDPERSDCRVALVCVPSVRLVRRACRMCVLARGVRRAAEFERHTRKLLSRACHEI